MQATKNDKPIVFIIDELDRCRPSYAVELLEQIKHFFAIEGIVFVLSIDKLQLGHAVKGFYGNDGIDADEYLRRFIDIEYSLPQPDPLLFCQYLYEFFGFNDFFTTDRHYKYGYQNEKDNVVDISVLLFKHYNATLRQQEKTFAHARIGLRSFREDQYVFPELYLILTIIRTFNNEFYLQIKSKRLTYDELLSKFRECMPDEIDVDTLHFFVKTEALLLFLFFNSKRGYGSKQLIEKDADTTKEKVIVLSKFDRTDDNIFFLDYIKSYHRDFISITLDHLLNRIDLVEPAVS